MLIVLLKRKVLGAYEWNGHYPLHLRCGFCLVLFYYIQSLTGIKGLSEAKVEKICEAAEKIVNFGYITGSDALLKVKIHRLFLQSKLRTRNKEEADFFFVPAYAKCVRMMGGLNEKEINQTYVQKSASQDMKSSAKRVHCLPPVNHVCDESQMQITRSNTNLMRKWSPPEY